ncbi:AraC family transcriptional regulator [Paucibacter sp. R3-3]|uniref:AraC family transcriptional regulator n=1 Tax=Roseateles agri TaxID=3098619 RepID=A0ABU5DRT1_9BURK|nr:AraC family transcriptional regulator [Paucibacter sp. R3-3]MDY0749029.1 AraC family transcriptional regulator [Paucibacter sp. R3-3]
MSASVSDCSEIRSWSTADVPEPKRLDYFAAAVSEAILPLAIDRANPREFYAELKMARLADVGVTSVSGNAHSVFRGRAEIARNGEPCFNLMMSLHTAWTAEHRGQMVLAPRDILVMDSRYPIRATVSKEFRAVNISVREAWLRRWLPDPNVLATRHIPGGSLWGLALSSYLSSMTPELAANPPLPLALMADQIGSLLALTASGIPGAWPQRSKAAISIRERIVSQIHQRCREQGLTAADVALGLGISLRTLHRALASEQQTFGGLLLDARAGHGMRMLQSTLFKLLTIEEIGYRAGFQNPSHFSRIIRSRSGRTPKQLRVSSGHKTD